MLGCRSPASAGRPASGRVEPAFVEIRGSRADLEQVVAELPDAAVGDRAPEDDVEVVVGPVCRTGDLAEVLARQHSVAPQRLDKVADLVTRDRVLFRAHMTSARGLWSGCVAASPARLAQARLNRSERESKSIGRSVSRALHWSIAGETAHAWAASRPHDNRAKDDEDDTRQGRYGDHDCGPHDY